MEKVFVVREDNPNTWNPPPPIFKAVAATKEAAMRWIEKEVIEKKNQYMQGKDAQWWIDQGYFSITEIEVFE